MMIVRRVSGDVPDSCRQHRRAPIRKQERPPRRPTVGEDRQDSAEASGDVVLGELARSSHAAPGAACQMNGGPREGGGEKQRTGAAWLISRVAALASINRITVRTHRRRLSAAGHLKVFPAIP